FPCLTAGSVDSAGSFITMSKNSTGPLGIVSCRNGIREQSQYGSPRRYWLRTPTSLFFIFGHDNQPDWNRLRSNFAPQLMGTLFRLLTRCVKSKTQRSAEWMHATVAVEHCEFIRVISRSGPKKFRYQGAFAAVAATRNNDGASLPAHNSRVNEKSVGRHFRDKRIYIPFEFLIEIGLIL